MWKEAARSLGASWRRYSPTLSGRRSFRHSLRARRSLRSLGEVAQLSSFPAICLRNRSSITVVFIRLDEYDYPAAAAYAM